MRRILLLALLFAVPASAQITPLVDDRTLTASVDYQGGHAEQTKTPPGFFTGWIDFATVQIDGAEVGSCNAEAYQNCSFFPAGIQFFASSGGGWQIIPGSYSALSHLRWKVRWTACLRCSIYCQVEPGDIPGSAWVEVRGPGGRVLYNDGGVIDTALTLPAGDYVFETKSSVASTQESLTGGTTAFQMTVDPCPTIITTQPTNAAVACDNTATFCVVPNGPVGSFTYQWRQAYVPILANNAHYLGANSNCLQVLHACYADTSLYDCVVSGPGGTASTNGVRVVITGTTVDAPPAAPTALSLGLAAPNPFVAAATLRYEAPAPFFGRATVYDAVGRTVRMLANRRFEASGVLTWDGRTDSGTPAVPGVYFLKLEAAGRAEVRRLALVR